MPTCHESPPFAVPAAPPVPGQVRTVALIGPPNSGKSTLFNRLTKLRQKVGNYPGVTVEQHTGQLTGFDHPITLVDLPGVYGLEAFSEDERVSLDVLNGKMPGLPRPDAVLLVLDVTNLSRQLSLAASVIAVGLPTMVLLNMSDLFIKRGGKLDPLKLAVELGAPVALISATAGMGMDAIDRFLRGDANQAPPTLRVLLNHPPQSRQWAAQVRTRSAYQPALPSVWSRHLDDILLHKIWGPIIFLVVVAGVFQTVFGIGKPLSDAFQNLLNDGATWAATIIPAGIFSSLLIDGLWKGLSSVLVFLPQILLLFLFIGILEDSGYLARAALISDRTLRGVGLNGKAFIPLLSAYACAVPAIMATRTIENKRERLATILIAPFMTCSARLPVYTLMIAAFIPNVPVLGPLLGARAAVMLSLYVLGFLAAFATAKLLSSSALKATNIPFVLELPEYRLPTLQSLALRLLDRGTVFLKQVGTVILAVSLVIWVLTSLPLHNGKTPPLEQSIIASLGHFIEPAIKPLGFNWKVGIGLLTSVVAREVMVGTLGTIYGTDPNTHSLPLQAALRQDLSLPGAMALLVFFAFAMQCTSTLAVVRRETNSWKWPAIQFAYMSGLAYVAALVVNQVLGLWW